MARGGTAGARVRRQVAAAAELASLREAPRRPGMAGNFYFDAAHDVVMAKLLPGEYFATASGLAMNTTLGSCIAACLWDSETRVGGMNHFLLPRGGEESTRYGLYAMEVLINELIRLGATRGRITAKIFGGGQLVPAMQLMNIGERNAAFVFDFLKIECIPVVSHDVMGPHARRVCFFPDSGRVLVRRLATTSFRALDRQERMAEQSSRQLASGGGGADLF